MGHWPRDQDEDKGGKLHSARGALNVSMRTLMKLTGACAGIVLTLSACLFADSNLRITDAGLHGYGGTPAAVQLIVRNPSPQPQTVHLRIAVGDALTDKASVEADVSLNGTEERQLELPVVIPAGQTKITADAFAGGAVFGHDVYDKTLTRATLVALMCASESICQSAQSQIEFSGNIQERADKNRYLRFAVVSDPREDWWAYTPATAIVLATALTKFTPEQQSALEGYLRRGGRLVLIEDEIADPDFLSTYRKGPAEQDGERVGKGTLYRVAGLSTNDLGEIFSGRNLPREVNYVYNATSWQGSFPVNWLRQRFAAIFHFPQLKWILIWLAVYILIIGVINFTILRRLRRLEFGWISMCVLALLFSAGFYVSSASGRPRQFRLDNLATYYLDSRSPLAAADYQLRISVPKRQDVLVSVADSALFTDPTPTSGEATSQIWTEINGQVAAATRQYDVRLGPPRQLDLSLLKWSFIDLNLEGLREFPGTVHFVGPNRVRNDTGLNFDEAVYYDGRGNVIYVMAGLAAGQEIELDTIPHKPITRQRQTWNFNLDQSKATLEDLALAGLLPFGGGRQVFAGFSDQPALPVELNIQHQEKVHSLIVVSEEQL
jgi:hypothetical protein